MASFKTLTDSDGKQYVFSKEKFSKKLKEITEKKTVDGKVKKVFLKDVISNISDKCCLTEDAVKKWKQGYNGPGDIETVKTVADVIGVEYLSLLTPVNKEKENTMFTTDEKKLISDVYSRLLSFYFTYFDPSKKIFSDEEEALEASRKRSIRHYKMDRELANIHDFISTHSLFISDYVKNTLHRIIAEAESNYEYNDTNQDYTSHHTCFDLHYFLYESKEEFIRAEDSFCYAYLYDEIALAEDLGYEYNDFDEKSFYDTEGKTEEEIYEMWLNMGVVDVEIKPIAVFKHEMNCLVDEVFKHFFPDLEM